MVAGRWTLVVVSSIHASVQLTSSRVKFSVGFSPSGGGGGGSVVLQLLATSKIIRDSM